MRFREWDLGIPLMAIPRLDWRQQKGKSKDRYSEYETGGGETRGVICFGQPAWNLNWNYINLLVNSGGLRGLNIS